MAILYSARLARMLSGPIGSQPDCNRSPRPTAQTKQPRRIILILPLFCPGQCVLIEVPEMDCEAGSADGGPVRCPPGDKGDLSEAKGCAGRVVGHSLFRQVRA